MRLVFAATLACAFANSALALAIHGYDAGANERFIPGTFANAPVANAAPGFTLAGYDLSGVGWRDDDPQFAITLISPEHFLTAAHAAPAAGNMVSFLGSDGLVRTYEVATVSTLQYNGGVNSDLALGRLNAPVVTDFITFYYGLYLGNTAAQYTDLPVTLYGARGRVGTNTVEAVGAYSLLPFPPAANDTVADSVVSVTD